MQTKFFSSAMPGAPVLSGTPGSLIAVLDACLVNGYGLQAAASVVVTEGVAVATFPSTHAAVANAVILVSGATPASLNGLQRVSVTTLNTISWPTAAPAGTATGAISIRLAPAGWVKEFSGTNVGVYRSGDVSSTRMFLRMDDTGTLEANLRGFESMSDVSTGIAPFPLDSQVNLAIPVGLIWSKSVSADAVARPWFVVADTRGFYFCVSPNLVSSYAVVYAGDIKSRKSGDAYGFVLSGNQALSQGIQASIPGGCLGYSTRTSVRPGAYAARSHTGLGGPVPVHRVGAHHIGLNESMYAGGANYGIGTFPNPAGNELLCAELEAYSSGGLRGDFPGLLHPIQNCDTTFSAGDVVQGTNAFAGRRLVAVRVGPGAASATFGTVFFDTTGPWR